MAVLDLASLPEVAKVAIGYAVLVVFAAVLFLMGER